MSVRRRAAALIALAALVCSSAYAPIFGTYPGLRPLIGLSDVVAAITILEQLSDEDFGGAARYKIRFDKVLKGAVSEEHTVADLRHLEITPQAEFERPAPPKPFPVVTYFAPTERLAPFRPQSRWLAFLSTAKEVADAQYENVNCAGSTYPISPLRDLEKLQVESLPDTLILLFREYVEFERAELTEREKQLDAFIHESDE